MTSPVIATLTGFIPLGGGTNNVATGWTVAANDYVVIALANATGDVQDVTGYTPLGSNSINGMVSLFGKKMTGGETTIPIVELAAAHQCYIAWQCRGQDLTTPQDAAATTSSGSASEVDSPSITTVVANSWVFSVGSVVTSGGSTPVAPSGYGDVLSAERTGSANHQVMGAIKQIVSPGAENPGAFSSSPASDWQAISWALRIAAAPPAGSSLIYLSPVASFSHMLVR